MQFQDLHFKFLKVSQASLEAQKSVLQIAESFTSIYRTELTESKQGKKSSNRKIKIKQQEKRRRTRRRRTRRRRTESLSRLSRLSRKADKPKEKIQRRKRPENGTTRSIFHPSTKTSVM